MFLWDDAFLNGLLFSNITSLNVFCTDYIDCLKIMTNQVIFVSSLQETQTCYLDAWSDLCLPDKNL